MSREKDLSEQEEKRLLKEYELCQDSSQTLESVIWQTGAVIGIGSIGSLALVAKDQPSWQVAAIIGLLVVLTARLWWFMAKRWWSIQHAKFLRMCHIEETLGLYQTRYVYYLDGLTRAEKKGNSRRQDKEDIRARRKLKERFLPTDPWVKDHLSEDMKDARANYQYKGVQDYLKCLPWLNLAAWSLYVIYLTGLWKQPFMQWLCNCP
jgi:hypothetical protein